MNRYCMYRFLLLITDIIQVSVSAKNRKFADGIEYEYGVESDP